ncbi:hypothetical protein QOZ80_4BG0360570 [Eleusine coracana subsp. coracana]|nr:hypothetical protein QOZ80_4BG0360570 [Eleusine coracana subsp. coracana]
MSAATDDTDGDRVIEVVSAGALYRGEEWERKYWSCSRGKDRYPYPVGYHTVRHFFGISYTMEVKEGPRGPAFLVTSTEGDSATGATPDLAWKNFKKKSGTKVTNWQRRRSFSQKIDGAELFGFKNASVQRLLRELIVYTTGAVMQKLPGAVIADSALTSLNKDTTGVFDVDRLPVCLDKTSRIGKRIMKPNQMEHAAKRVHYKDTFPSVASSSESAQGNASEGDVSDSRRGRVPDNLKCTSISIDDNFRRPSQNSSQQVDLSSLSDFSSQKSDLESAEMEAARFMLSSLLPQAIPFLKKSKKKSKQKRNDIFTGLLRTASGDKPSNYCCKGATVSTTVDKGTNINSSETYLHGGSPCDMAKGGSANGDCSKDECVVKLHGIKDVVEDTFEDVDSWDDDTSKSRVVHHYVSDDACSREPNEHSKDEFEVKLDEMKDVVEDSFEDAYILADNPLKSRAVCHHMSDDACSRQPNQHSKDDSVAKLDEMKDVVEDSFEEDANIWGDGTFKSRTIRYHTSDDACSRLRDEHSKNESAEDTFDQHEHICGDSTSKTRAVCHHMSDDACSRQPNEHLKDESVAKLDEMIDFVEDSFEEDAHIMGDNTSKFRAFGHHVSDDACSIEPNEHPKVLDGIIKGHVETFECQVNVHDGTKTPDVIYDHEKGKLNTMFLTMNIIMPFLAEDQKHASPRFVGYTPLILPSLEQSSTGNYTFGRSCFTPDGQFVVLMSSVGIPFCRLGNIDCLCCVCKSHRLSCILVCEPNYIVAAESNRNLHIWKMVTGWSKTSEDYVIPSLGQLELRRISRKNSVIIGHDGAGGFCLWDISRRTLLATFAAPGNIIFQILPVGFCSFQDMIHAPVNDIEKRLQEVTVSDMCTKVDRDSFQLAQREDIAVWVLVSSVSIAEYQHDPRLKNHNARWRLALLANKRIFMGNILDSSATAVDTSGNYGFAGTYGGLLYMWELSSGRKLAGTQCIDDGRVSCIGVDAESGAVAVADDGCRLLVYTQNSEGTK